MSKKAYSKWRVCWAHELTCFRNAMRLPGEISPCLRCNFSHKAKISRSCWVGGRPPGPPPEGQSPDASTISSPFVFIFTITHTGTPSCFLLTICSVIQLGSISLTSRSLVPIVTVIPINPPPLLFNYQFNKLKKAVLSRLFHGCHNLILMTLSRLRLADSLLQRGRWFDCEGFLESDVGGLGVATGRLHLSFQYETRAGETWNSLHPFGEFKRGS